MTEEVKNIMISRLKSVGYKNIRLEKKWESGLLATDYKGDRYYFEPAVVDNKIIVGDKSTYKIIRAIKCNFTK